MGLPRGSISRTVVESGDRGAWNQLERGELTLSEFAEKFTKEVTQRVKQIYSVLSNIKLYDCKIMTIFSSEFKTHLITYCLELVFFILQSCT